MEYWNIGIMEEALAKISYIPLNKSFVGSRGLVFPGIPASRYPGIPKIIQEVNNA